ncbi:hypothetical protein DYB10_18435 [Vibrio cholerae]|uniref:Metallothionein SmtA n=1 Tax=Enterococcus faecium (strain ATCC BAA-472 / TX0016 / DO) TaxID=333849 RepID=I3U3I5_ENTFD|nr:metallothionein SmtA [Enterococcus faecium DO]EGR2524022.1 hypothetical protein [Vibrio cholerae]
MEAIFIEYAILEDRFESVLHHDGMWKAPEPGNFVPIRRKITFVKKATEEKRSGTQLFHC